MKNKNKGAFALRYQDADGGVAQLGLTKREYFAAAALQGLLANETHRLRTCANDGTVADEALKQADALIKALEQTASE